MNNMKWYSIKSHKPELGQEVLVFEQGYSISGKHYWSAYELSIYDIDYSDRRKKAFYQSLAYRVEKRYDGSTMGNVWRFKSVTHWMPLPEKPEQITKEQYAKARGIEYESSN